MMPTVLPEPAPAAAIAIEARAVSKAYEGTLALDAVDFSVAVGEVHGLVGKNGAGKSTLLRILAGAVRPDSGEIAIAAVHVAGLNPIAAARAGIAVVYQNAELHPNLSVAANIFLGSEPRTRLRLVDDAAMEREAEALLARLGLTLPIGAMLGDLDIAHRQQVAIAKAVRANARVLLLDEPTAALNKSQTDFLFRLIRSLAASGIAVVYISHHLDEVLAIADRITVLRNGRRVGVVAASSVNKADLVEMIAGHGVAGMSERRRPSVKLAPRLSLEAVSLPRHLHDVSLDVGAGEIVGLTGRTGAGARMLASVVAGITPATGNITLDGAPFAPRSIREAIARGVVFAAEDMRQRGLVMAMSAAANMTLARLRAVARRGVIMLGREREEAARLGDFLDLTPRDPSRPVMALSGGNQRKVLIGRAVFADARVLVLEEPTQGVDVEARRQIHDRLRQLADRGAAIVFFSTDLEELIELADRIVILNDGRIDREFDPDGLAPELLLAAIQAGGPDERRHD
jgi:ABC-type sugar transport system ATPase subunit